MAKQEDEEEDKLFSRDENVGMAKSSYILKKVLNWAKIDLGLFLCKKERDTEAGEEKAC